MFEAEAIGLTLAVKLLLLLPSKPQLPIHIFIDNQATARSSICLTSKRGHYILMKLCPLLHAVHHKFNITKDNIIITWAPSHKNIKGNKLANKEAQCAATHPSQSSHALHLPTYLCCLLPSSVSALKQANRETSKNCWSKEWAKSPHFVKMKLFGLDKPSNIFIKLISHLSKHHVSMLIWLQTGHSSLCSHLHHIKKANSPYCSFCSTSQVVKSVRHILVKCPQYVHE